MSEQAKDLLTPKEREALQVVLGPLFGAAEETKTVAAALARLAPEPPKPARVAIATLPGKWRAVATELRRNNLYAHEIRASELDGQSDELDGAIADIDVNSVASALCYRERRWGDALQDARVAIAAVIGAVGKAK